MKCLNLIMNRKIWVHKNTEFCYFVYHGVNNFTFLVRAIYINISKLILNIMCLCIIIIFRDDEEEDSTSFTRPIKNIPNEELHFSEKWFHGRLTKGREEAEQLLKTYSHLGMYILF